MKTSRNCTQIGWHYHRGIIVEHGEDVKYRMMHRRGTFLTSRYNDQRTA